MRTPAGRLRGVDAARGAALLAMMAVHVLPATDADGQVTPSHLLAHGRAAAAFALLAGVSLGLATRRLTSGDQRWAPTAAGVLARAGVVGVIGLAVGYVDSGLAVILPYYAVLFVLAVPLLRLSAPALVAVAVLAGTVVPVLSHALRADLGPPDRANPTFATVVERPAGLLTELLLTGYYPALPWLAYLAAGLAVSRVTLTALRTSVGLLVVGVALTAVAHACSWLLLDVAGGREPLATAVGMDPSSVAFDQLLLTSQYGATPTTTWWWLAVAGPHTTTPFDLASTTGTALALLGMLLLIGRRAGVLLVPLAAAGSMTLTLYTAHVVAVGTMPLPVDEQMSYAAQAAAALGVGLLWRAAFRRGPLEAVASGVATVAHRAVRP